MLRMEKTLFIIFFKFPTLLKFHPDFQIILFWHVKRKKFKRLIIWSHI